MASPSEPFAYGYTSNPSSTISSTNEPTSSISSTNSTKERSSSFNMSVAQEEWAKIQDAAERRKIQNRNAQRKYRRNLKRRVEDLERQNAFIAFTNGGSMPSGDASSPTNKTRETSPRDGSDKNEDPAVKQQSMSPKTTFEHHGLTRSSSTSDFNIMTPTSNDWIPQPPAYISGSSLQSGHLASHGLAIGGQSPHLSTTSMDHDGHSLGSDSLLNLTTINDYFHHNNTLLEEGMQSPTGSSNSDENHFANAYGGLVMPPNGGMGTPMGRTTLHLAAMKGYLPIVQMLLERGIDINARDNNGWTALHLAAERGQQQVVKLLLDRGADLYARI